MVSRVFFLDWNHLLVRFLTLNKSTLRLFILEGAATALIGLLGFWLLPDTPLTTRWLNEEERKIAHERMERDRVDDQGESSVMVGLKQAVKDPKAWAFCLMQNLHLSACSFNSFFPT